MHGWYVEPIPFREEVLLIFLLHNGIVWVLMQTALAPEFPKASSSCAVGAFDWRVIHSGLGCNLVWGRDVWDQHHNDLSTQKLVFPYEIQKKNVCKSRGKVMCFWVYPVDSVFLWYKIWCGHCQVFALSSVFSLSFSHPLKSYTMRKAAMVVAPQPWGRHSKNWIFLGICAFHLTNLFLFAVSKQAPSHVQRQKEGLYVNIPVGRSCSSAVNYPGIKIELTREEQLLVSQLDALAKTLPRGAWRQAEELISDYTGYSPLVFTAAMQVAFKTKKYPDGIRMYESLRAANALLTEPVSRHMLATDWLFHTCQVWACSFLPFFLPLVPRSILPQVCHYQQFGACHTLRVWKTRFDKKGSWWNTDDTSEDLLKRLLLSLGNCFTPDKMQAEVFMKDIRQRVHKSKKMPT